MESLRTPCQPALHVPLTAIPEVPVTGVRVPENHVTNAKEASVMATELPFSAAL